MIAGKLSRQFQRPARHVKGHLRIRKFRVLSVPYALYAPYVPSVSNVPEQ